MRSGHFVTTRGMDDDRDDDEFPPTLHPKRELLTGCLAAILVALLIGWGLWSLAWRALGVFQ